SFTTSVRADGTEGCAAGADTAGASVELSGVGIPTRPSAARATPDGMARGRVVGTTGADGMADGMAGATGAALALTSPHRSLDSLAAPGPGAAALEAPAVAPLLG